MAKLQHNNLFQHGDKAAVYAAFQRDLGRDSRHHLFWLIVMIFAGMVTSDASGDSRVLWVALCLYAGVRVLEYFVDISSRNWAMHVIDWVEHARENDETR